MRDKPPRCCRVMGVATILVLFAMCQVAGAMCIPSKLPSATDASLSMPVGMHCPMPAGPLCQPTFSLTKERESKLRSIVAVDPVAYHSAHVARGWEGRSEAENGPRASARRVPVSPLNAGAAAVLRI